MRRNQIGKIESHQLAVLKAFEIQFDGKFSEHGCGFCSKLIRCCRKAKRQLCEYQQDCSRL
jgi:hypothetical protein